MASKGKNKSPSNGAGKGVGAVSIPAPDQSTRKHKEALKPLSGDFRKSDLTEYDDFARATTFNYLRRAGLSDYVDELRERLSDIETTEERAFYVFPVKLTKKLAKSLLAMTLRESEAQGNAEWTERDQIEMLIKIHEGMTLDLQKSGGKP